MSSTTTSPTPAITPTPSSTISVIGHTVGFQFHGIDNIPLVPDASDSRLSLIRRKHLSHINALESDGFDFLPPDAQEYLAGLHHPPRSPSPPMPMNWKTRLLASASASTLRISGVTKKLKNKVILLRDVLLPQSLNQPPPPVYHSQTAPTPFSNLAPPVKHEFVTQRIICLKDIAPNVFDSEYDDEKYEESNGLVSPSWVPTRKHLSTLQEEEDWFDGSDDDSEPQPDVYLEAVLMPVENLNVHDISRTLGSPARSRVSPPWMHKPLGDSTATLRPEPQSQYLQPGRRPQTSSTFDSRDTGSGSYGEIVTPTLRFDVDANSVFRMSVSTADNNQPYSPTQAMPRQSQNLHPSHAVNRRQSIMSFISTTDSSYGTGARRRSSSLAMMPISRTGSTRGMRERGSTVSGGPDKENEGGGYPTSTFGKNARRGGGRHVEEEEEEEDDDGEGEEQEYYVFEANPDGSLADGTQRESVLILLPVPNDASPGEIPDEDAEEDDYVGDYRLQSRWSTSIASEDKNWDETISNPFLTPMPPQKPLPSIPPSIRDRSSIATSYATAPYAPTPMVTQSQQRPPPTSNFTGSRKILPIQEMDLDRDTDIPVQKASTTSLPIAERRQQEGRQASRPLTPLNWSSGVIPEPAPSPSFTLAPLAPPKTKPASTNKSSVSVNVVEPEREKEVALPPRRPTVETGSLRRKSGARQLTAEDLERRGSGGPAMSRSRSLSTSTFGAGGGEGASIRTASPKLRTSSKLAVEVIPGPSSPLTRQRSKSTGPPSKPKRALPPPPTTPAPPPPVFKNSPRRPTIPPPPIPISAPVPARSTPTPTQRPRTPKTPVSGKSKHAHLPSLDSARTDSPKSRKSDRYASLPSVEPTRTDSPAAIKAQQRQTAEFLKSSGKAFQGHPFVTIEVEVVDEGSSEREVYAGGSVRSKKSSRASADGHAGATSSPASHRMRPSI